MRKRKLAILLGGALTLLSGAADAGSAPKELYGKSIGVAWTESVTGKYATEEMTRSFGRSCQMQVYISTAGRPFVRLRQAGFGSFWTGTMRSYTTSSMKTDTAPGQSTANDHVDFEGHSIVVYREFQSGARRIAIDFDGLSSSCKAVVIVGKQAGMKVMQQRTGHGMFDVSSVQIGSVSCSIHEGNVFGQ